jgi:putative ATPase
VVTLIGATTENPSFELIGALLSRVRVFVLEPLTDEHLREIIHRAVCEMGKVKGETGDGIEVSDEAVDAIVKFASGDARQALNALEALLNYVRSNASLFTFHISRSDVESVLSRRLPQYDKSGESHFNIISALHKAVRGSDVEGALYWLARMIVGGEDPLYLARRMVRMATEDIGLADPRALSVALAAKDAYHFLGSPEGELALAEAAIYLATAPKSNRVYEAWSEALHAAREHPAEPVPLHIRNAPTGLMKELGYGKGYRYDHAEADALAAGQEYLPDALKGAKWYAPTDRGYEKTVGERLEWWEKVKREARQG